MNQEQSQIETERVESAIFSSVAAIGPDVMIITETDMIPMNGHIAASDLSVPEQLATKIFSVYDGVYPTSGVTTFNVWALLMANNTLRRLFAPYKHLKVDSIDIILTNNCNAFVGQTIGLSYLPGYSTTDSHRFTTKIDKAYNRATAPQIVLRTYPATPYEGQEIWPDPGSYCGMQPLFGSFGIAALSPPCSVEGMDPTGRYHISIRLNNPELSTLASDRTKNPSLVQNIINVSDLSYDNVVSWYNANFFTTSSLMDAGAALTKRFRINPTQKDDRPVLTNNSNFLPPSNCNTITVQTNNLVDNRKGFQAIQTKESQDIFTLHGKNYTLLELMQTPGYLRTDLLIAPDSSGRLEPTLFLEGCIFKPNEENNEWTALKAFAFPAAHFTGSLRYVFMFNLPANVTSEIALVRIPTNAFDDVQVSPSAQYLLSTYECATCVVGGTNSIVVVDFYPNTNRVVQPVRGSTRAGGHDIQSVLALYVLGTTSNVLLSASVTVLELAGPDLQLYAPIVKPNSLNKFASDNGYAGDGWEGTPTEDDRPVLTGPDLLVKPSLDPTFCITLGRPPKTLPGSQMAITHLDELSHGSIPFVGTAQPSAAALTYGIVPIPVTPTYFSQLPYQYVNLLNHLFLGFYSEGAELAVRGDQDSTMHMSIPPIGWHGSFTNQESGKPFSFNPSGLHAMSMNPNQSYYSQTRGWNFYTRRFDLLERGVTRGAAVDDIVRRGGHNFSSSLVVNALNYVTYETLKQVELVLKFNPQYLFFRGIPSNFDSVVNQNFITSEPYPTLQLKSFVYQLNVPREEEEELPIEELLIE